MRQAQCILGALISCLVGSARVILGLKLTAYAAWLVLGQLAAHARARYELEPYIRDFAGFSEGTGKDVLEVGVGMGADHLEWARARPRALNGCGSHGTRH
jgi:hypothetical protein